MRKGTWSAVVLSVLVVSGKLAWAEPVPVLNPSFEAQVLAVGGFTNGTLTNWVLSQGKPGGISSGHGSIPRRGCARRGECGVE